MVNRDQKAIKPPDREGQEKPPDHKHDATRFSPAQKVQDEGTSSSSDMSQAYTDKTLAKSSIYCALQAGSSKTRSSKSVRFSMPHPSQSASIASAGDFDGERKTGRAEALIGGKIASMVKAHSRATPIECICEDKTLCGDRGAVLSSSAVSHDAGTY